MNNSNLELAKKVQAHIQWFCEISLVNNYLEPYKKRTKRWQKGGNVEVLPVKNPDILTLFPKKENDGAWIHEPWFEKDPSKEPTHTERQIIIEIKNREADIKSINEVKKFDKLMHNAFDY